MFKALRQADLPSQIADEVLTAIGDGRLKPGDHVAEARLAEQLGTSRAPVREALRLLESQGLIISYPRRGFFVNSYDSTELAEIYDLRECLELHNAQALIARLTAPAMAALRDQIDLMVRLAQEGQLQKQVNEDYAFHRMLVEIGGNSRILKLYDQIARELQAGIAIVGHVYDDPADIAREHLALMVGLEARDVTRFRADLKEHLQDARTHIMRLQNQKDAGGQ